MNKRSISLILTICLLMQIVVGGMVNADIMNEENTDINMTVNSLNIDDTLNGTSTSSAILGINVMNIEVDLTGYQAELDLSVTLLESDYTVESWGSYQTALTENVVDETYTQEEIDIAVNNIMESRGQLLYANQNILDEAVSEKSLLKSEDYTIESWQLLLDTEELGEESNQEVEDKTQAIYDAIGRLVKLVPDLTQYNSVLLSVDELNYDEYKWLIYELVLERNVATEDNLVSEIDELISIINIAQANILNSELDFTAPAVIIRDTFEIDYDENLWAEYKDELREIKFEDAETQEEVDELVPVIIQVKDNKLWWQLESWPVVNEFLFGDEDVHEKMYTVQSWAEYDRIMEEKDLHSWSYGLKISEALKQIDMVREARKVLVPINDCVIPLLEIMDEVEMLSYSDYTDESWSKFSKFMKTIEVTREETAEEVTEKVNLIRTEINKLVRGYNNWAEFNYLMNKIQPEEYKYYDFGTYEYYKEQYASLTEDSLESEIAEAIRMLNFALDYYTRLKVENYPELKKLILKFDENEYTEGSWNAFKIVFDTNRYPNVNVEAVEEAKNNIILASADLVRINELVDLTEYNTLVNSIHEVDYGYRYNEIMEFINSLDIDEQSKQAEVSNAIVEIKTFLLDYGYNKDRVYYEIYDYMTSALVFEIDRNIFETEQMGIYFLEESDYTEESWDAYQEYLDNIVIIRNEDSWEPYILNLSKSEALDLWEEIINKQKELLVALPFEESKLLEYTELINSAKEEDFMAESWNKYQEEISKYLYVEGTTPRSAYTIIRNKIVKSIKETLILKVTDETYSEFTELMDKINNSYNPYDYTRESWDKYIDIIESINVTQNDTENEVREAVDKIKNANIYVLKPLHNDTESFYKALENMVKEAEENIGKFTVESKQKFWESIYELPIDDDTLQSEMDQVYEYVNYLAESTLILQVAVDMHSMMINAIQPQDAYDETAWNQFIEGLENHTIGENSTQRDYNEALDFLGSKIFEELVYKQSHEAIEIMLSVINEEIYTKESLAIYKALTRKIVFKETETPEETRGKIDNINNAIINHLVRKDGKDIETIMEDIEKALSIESDYTTESWVIYEAELEEIDKIAPSRDIEKRKKGGIDYNSVMTNKLYRLKLAKGLLVRIPTDLTAYNEVVDRAIETDYTEDSWEIYGMLLDREIVTEARLQSSVDRQTRVLSEEQKNLVKWPADLTEYNEILSKVNKDDYTADSWTVYETIVNENIIAEDSLRSEVVNTIVTLNEAQKNLIKKQTGGSSVGSGGGSGSGSGGGAIPEEPVKPVEPAKPIEEDKKLEIDVEGNKVILVVKESIRVKEEIKGYVNGYSDNTFRPENKVTRAETSQMLANIFETSGMLKSDVTDVNENAWYSGAVKGIMSAGVMNGYDDKTFKPENNITRQEFAVTLVNLMDLSSMEIIADKEFPDVNNTYGTESIKLLASIGVINGYPDGTFGPDREITRAEMIVILNRLLGNKLVAGGFVSAEFTDIEDSWAKEEIMKALGK